MFLAFGNLNNGVSNYGLSYVNGNNTLSNTNWNYLGRLSGYIILYTCSIFISADKIDQNRPLGLVGERTPKFLDPERYI